MGKYDNLSIKKTLEKVKQGNNGSVIASASGGFSAALIPIIIMLINKIGDADNTTLIIALSLICIVTIISTVIGIIIMNSNKGADDVLKRDLGNLEKFMADHFEIKGGGVCPKAGVDINKISKKIPKNIVKNAME